MSRRGSLVLLAKYWGFGSGEPISARLWLWKMWGDLYLAKSRSASLDMVMFVRFCCRTNMFRHIFLIPDSLILLKYCAPFIRIQEIRCPRPSVREQKRVKLISQNNTTEYWRSHADLQRCTGTCAAAERPPSLPLWLKYPCWVWPPAGRNPCFQR